jgi:hypothetical protein
MYFTLDDQNKPLPTEDVLIWAAWHDKNKDHCCIGVDFIGELEVSTQFFGTEFLGLWCLWETMVFDADRVPIRAYTKRYGTYEEAVEGHQRVVEECRRRGGER